LRETDGEDEPEEDIWGGSDEEPDDSQKELMRRTATHILSSPNPPQLEMRILANYGGDKRFAFLRGRWAHFWKLEKIRVKAENEASKKGRDEERSGTGLVGLADYGDSDQDDDDGDEELESNAEVSAESKKIEESASADDGHVGHVSDGDGGESDTAIKEARRARAKEWAKKRRALTSSKI